MLYEMDWVKAEKEYRLSLYLKPDYATTHHWLAELLLYTGRSDEAMAEINRAVELEPLSPAMSRDKGVMLYYLGRFDEAIDLGKKALALDRTFVTAHRLLSLAFVGKGMTANAIAENQLWGELTGNRIEAGIWLAYIQAASGDEAGARELLAAIPLEKLSTGYQYRAMGVVCATLGEDDAAFEWLGKALEARTESIASMKIDFKLERLRPDPRFAALLKKIGLGK